MKPKLLTLFCLLLVLTCAAQEEPATGTMHEPKNPSVEGALSLIIGRPTGGMQDAIRNNMFGLGFGLNLSALWNPFKKSENNPLRLGGEIGYTYYGRFKTEVRIGGQDGAYKTSYGIANLVGLIRLRSPLNTRVVPFADIIGGGNFYISNVKEDLNAIESALGIPGFDFGGTFSGTFVKGAGVGFRVRGKDPQSAGLVIRFSYVEGSSKIRYIVRNSLQQNGGSLTYQEGRSPVTYFALHVGIGL